VIDAPGTQGTRTYLAGLNRTEQLAADARRLQYAVEPAPPQVMDVPPGDVLNLPQTTTPRMPLGEEFPPFSGTSGEVDPLGKGDPALTRDPFQNLDPIVPFPVRPRPKIGLDTKTAQAMIRWAKLIGVNLQDLGNIIRSNLASSDMSFLRQQKKFLASHPVELAKSFKEFWKSAWTQEYADSAARAMANDPDMPMLSVDGFPRQQQLYKKLKLTFLRGTPGAGRSQREESLFILGEEASKSRPFVWLAQHSPWINISGRAFVGGIDAMNWGMWKGHLRSLFKIQEGIANGTITRSSGLKGQFAPGHVPLKWDLETEALAYGHMLEEMTGRARLGPFQELSPALTQGFFSIRQRLGLLLSPRHMFSPHRAVRKEAWKNFMSSIAAHSAVVLGGRQLGLWDVETDPRSSDFMKIKLFGGRVRIDIWGGNQQYLVLYARMLMGIGGAAGFGEGGYKSTKTGKVSTFDPLQTLFEFTRSAQAPGVTTGVAAVFGKDYRGEDIDRGDWRFWAQNNIPMVLEDVREAYEAEGLLEAAIVAPIGFIGDGIQAHELTEQDVALQMEFNIGGRVVTGIDYDDLPEVQRKRVLIRLKTMRSQREREGVKKKAEESKQKAKAREAERRQSFYGGSDRRTGSTGFSRWLNQFFGADEEPISPWLETDSQTSSFPYGVIGNAERVAPRVPAPGLVEFLRTGKAAHPDEQEVQDEYNLMMDAVKTGKNVNSAIAVASSHLQAHRRALLPENLNNPTHNPYVGRPEENQRAITGFRRVITYLQGGSR